MINGAGATFPYPIYSKWFDQFHKATDRKSTISPWARALESSRVTEGTVDFGASDGPMNDEQLKAYRDKWSWSSALSNGAGSGRSDL